MFLTGFAAVAGGAAVFAIRDRLPHDLDIRFADGRRTPWLPLQPGRGLVEIDVTVNGRPVRAVVDTGAQLTAIDRALADDLGLARTIAAPILAYGVSGAPSLTHTVTLDLATPGLSVPGVRAAALDLAELSGATGREFQLLIGRNVLRELILEVDFPMDRARFLAPGTYRAPVDGQVIPLKAGGGGAPTVPVSVEGRPPLDLLLDTGASGWLALSETAAEQLGLLAAGRPVTRAQAVSLGGVRLDRVTQASHVNIGDLSLQRVPVQIYAPALRFGVPTGLVGAGALQGLRVAVDLGGRRVVLAPPSLRIVPEQRPDHVGSRRR
ncbi:MAG: aspartyl protease family protein [Pseudomonadota bacterium]